MSLLPPEFIGVVHYCAGCGYLGCPSILAGQVERLTAEREAADRVADLLRLQYVQLDATARRGTTITAYAELVAISEALKAYDAAKQEGSDA